MEGSLKLPVDSSQAGNKSSKNSKVTEEAVAGKIAEHIGTGSNAKDSVIWITITWSFRIAATLCGLLFVRSFLGLAKEEDLLDSLVQIWSVFVPIITLALGYAFGKGD